jgi:transposase
LIEVLPILAQASASIQPSFLLKLYADGGYQGPEFRKSVKAVLSQVQVEIVKRSDQAKGFVVLPKRWVVERTLASRLAMFPDRWGDWGLSPVIRWLPLSG